MVTVKKYTFPAMSMPGCSGERINIASTRHTGTVTLATLGRVMFAGQGAKKSLTVQDQLNAKVPDGQGDALSSTHHNADRKRPHTQKFLVAGHQGLGCASRPKPACRALTQNDLRLRQHTLSQQTHTQPRTHAHAPRMRGSNSDAIILPATSANMV